MDSLRKQVKRKLNVTWSDLDTEEKISDTMIRAKSVMFEKIGITDSAFDFSRCGLIHTLYLTYCLYIWNDCEDEFNERYQEDILQAREMYEVKYAKEN